MNQNNQPENNDDLTVVNAKREPVDLVGSLD